MADLGPSPSRRALLGALTATPIMATALNPVAAPWASALGVLHDRYDAEPITLIRSRGGRRLSRFRYHNAETFFGSVEAGILTSYHDLLYQAGIAAQLGLSAHLLDVGFDDRWCARHIGLSVAKSLAYAKATGLGLENQDVARFATVLSPYKKWNHSRLWEAPGPDGGFAVDEIRRLTRLLLDRVYEVTGHRRPDGWSRRGLEAGGEA